MPHDHETAIEQVRSIAAPLSSAERLALISAIASLEPHGQKLRFDTESEGHEFDSEQEAWFARPLAERRRFKGQYVAVRGGQVVDHDSDQRALYLRTRAKLGGQPILIVKADWDESPTFTIAGALALKTRKPNDRVWAWQVARTHS